MALFNRKAKRTTNRIPPPDPLASFFAATLAVFADQARTQAIRQVEDPKTDRVTILRLMTVVRLGNLAADPRLLQAEPDQRHAALAILSNLANHTALAVHKEQVALNSATCAELAVLAAVARNPNPSDEKVVALCERGRLAPVARLLWPDWEARREHLRPAMIPAIAAS